MEANHKAGSSRFMRGKLAKSLFRSTKPSKPVVQSSSKVSPSPYTPNVTIPADSFIRHSYYANPPPIQKVPTTKVRSMPDFEGDNNVDMKAETYISYVRERFKLEKADLEAL